MILPTLVRSSFKIVSKRNNDYFTKSIIMANPQREDGHVRIANEILDVFSRMFFNSREWNIIFFVIRKTWGFNKKLDNIPLTQFQRGCFLSRGHVCKILAHLVSQRVLLKTEDGYGLNKNYDEWVVSQGRRSLTADNGVVSQQTTKLVSQRRPSIDNTKDNIQKTRPNSQKGVGKSPKKKVVVFQEKSMPYILAKHLYGEILNNNPNVKAPNFQKWAGEVDKMIRIDSRTIAQIDYLIHWSQSDKFWFKNILSTSKLREQFDTLIVHAKADAYKKKDEQRRKALQNIQF